MYDYPVWQALKGEGEGEFERMRARGAWGVRGRKERAP